MSVWALLIFDAGDEFEAVLDIGSEQEMRSRAAEYPTFHGYRAEVALVQSSASSCDPSQTSTGLDDLPADRAPEVSAHSASAPTDPATSTPDRAVDVAGTTGPTS